MTTPDANGWLPIESAPKDVTILVAWKAASASFSRWNDSNRVSVAYWRTNHPAPHWQCEDAAFMHILNPSHWQPLPKPPVSEANK